MKAGRKAPVDASTPTYGSWLLGRVWESQSRRPVRIQSILTVFIVVVNTIGIGVDLMLVTVAFLLPSIFTDAPVWFITAVTPGYIVIALTVAAYWITRRMVTVLRWAIEERAPSRADERNTFLAPARVAVVLLILWGLGAALFTTLYGLTNSRFIPKCCFGEFLRRSGGHRVLSVHRVRAAPVCRPGT